MNTSNNQETAFTEAVALVLKLYLWKCPIAGSRRIRQLTNGALHRRSRTRVNGGTCGRSQLALLVVGYITAHHWPFLG